MRCWLGHKWQRWVLIKTTVKQLEISGDRLTSSFELGAGQSRECSTCGLVEIRAFPRGYVIKETPAPAQEAGGPQSTGE